MMKVTINRLALLFVVLIMSLPINSQSRDETKERKLDKTKESIVQSERREVAKGDSDQDGHDGEYWFNRGFELHQSDHYVEAIEAFSHAIGLGYRQATAIYNVACGYAKLNDKENAIFWLDRALAGGFDGSKYLKDDSDLDPLRGDARFKELLQKASATRSETNAGKTKENKNRDRLDEAIINFEQLGRSSSQDGDQWYKVGSRLLGLRDFDRAEIALKKAITLLGFRGSSAMYNLACNYALKGDRENGLQWLEKSINSGFDETEKVRNDPDIVSLRGDPRFKRLERLSEALSLSAGNGDDWPAAVKRYESFLGDEPKSGRGWFNLGYALHYSMRHTEAIKAFERAIQLGYREPTSMYNIGCAYSMIGNRDAAFEWLEKSLQAGFNVADYVNGDSDLDNLRSDARFKRFRDLSEEQHKNKQKSER